MKSNNATDSDIRHALAAQLEPLLPAEGWQERVLAEMDATNRRRTRRRRLVAAAITGAAAAVVLLFSRPMARTEYIYTPEYYAALPSSQLSIADEVSAIMSESEPSPMNFYEPYTPLPE